MRISNYFIPTLKEVPSDAQMVSHRLMLRAGLIRPLGAGVYSFLPLGYRALKRAMQIIREEMDGIGGQEFHLPALNPIELWEQTDRVKAFGDTMFHIKNRPIILAPTHEEVICWIAKNEVRSYRDLPQIWYQIQTKFRNEPRPRSGVIRGRQFLMKDSYSLDTSWEGLDKSYDAHAEAYKRMFSRAGLKFFIVGASSGAMGGSASQEFMIESEAGEDTCVLCDKCGYAANLEVATSTVGKAHRDEVSKSLSEIHTPNVKTIDELVAFLGIHESRFAKSLVYVYDKQPILLLLMGNDQLNEAKLMGVLKGEARPMTAEEIKDLTGADPGSIGPIGLKKFRIYVDKRLEGANNLISGANKNDWHIGNIDLARDVKVDGYVDLRVVQPDEACSVCGAPLRVVKAIELGHVFKLGTKYSDALNATFLDEAGVDNPIIMGSYGIGVERVIACLIEQSNDDNGIIWSKSLAPFHVHIVLLNAKNEQIAGVANSLYDELQKLGLDVLYDDRTEVSPGFKFKDADLLGMPLQLVVSEKNVQNGNVEIKDRKTGQREIMPIGGVVGYIKQFFA